MAAGRLHVTDSRRRCGACNACCTHLRVPSINKAADETCPHLRPGVCGCGIHEARPQECRNFTCAWLDGGLSLDDRPDKIGVIFFAQHGTAFSPDEPVLAVKSVWPDGLIAGRAKVLFDLLRQKRLLLLISPDRRELFGPIDQVTRAEQRLKAWLADNGAAAEGVRTDFVRQGQ